MVVKMLKPLVFLSAIMINCTSCTLVNLNVIRTVDVTKIVTKMNVSITFVNAGPDTIASYYFMLDYCSENKYVIEFYDERNRELTYDVGFDVNSTDFRHALLMVNMRNDLEVNQVGYLRVNADYMGCSVPYLKRKFWDDQMLYFKGNTQFSSLYKTDSLETEFLVQTEKIETISEIPHVQNVNSIVYIYNDLKPNSVKPFRMKFVENSPRLLVTKLERTIDVSHFGKIFIRDQIYVQNKGSKLVGPYEPSSLVPKTSPNWLYTHLPASAENINYFDELGNNSNSQVIHFNDWKTLKYRLRYPLLGGWKSVYMLSYAVPTYEYLSTDRKNNFKLYMRVLDHVLNDMCVSEAVVNVMLPDGAIVLKMHTPKRFSESDVVWKHTSLSLFGRPTIVIKGTMLLETHISSFDVEYSLPTIYLWKGPFLIILYVEAVFVSIILFQKL